MTRGQRGRLIGRAMIWLAVVAIAVTALVTLFPPGFTGPMFLEPSVWSKVLPALAVAGLIVGLGWMIRIYRSDPEPDQHAWRYRAKR